METNRQKKNMGYPKDLVDILQGEVRKMAYSTLIISVSKVTVTTDLSVRTVYLSVFAIEILAAVKSNAKQ
jgi:ribosome-binding factor A